jgi:large subunit ribosomal protein L9
MKVILLSDLRNRGRRGSIIEVKPGYARNFLLPQGIALPATDGNIKYFEQQKKKIDAHHDAQRSAAADIAAKLDGLKLTVAKRVADATTLYGSVTASEIAQLLVAQGFDIDRRRIDLEGGIKTTGEHPVRIELHSEVVAEVIIDVVAEA